MTVDDYNAFCKGLPATNYVNQWGGAHVWKIGPKMFVAAWDDAAGLQVTFKATEMGYEIMRDMPGLRPAPYMASRGMKWIQHYAVPGLSDDDLRAHIKASYDMVVPKLTRAQRADLGL